MMKYDFFTVVPFVFLATIITIVLLKHVFSKTRINVFSPIVFFSLSFIYYIIVPYVTSDKDIYEVSSEYGLPLLMVGALLNYSSILLGFNFNKKKYSLKKFNGIFVIENAKYLSIALFLISFLGYGIINGFTLSFLGNKEYSDFDENASYNNPTHYIINFISFFPSAICLLYAFRSKFKRLGVVLVLMFFLSISIYLIEGFRYRLVLFIIPIFIFYHLYPKVKRINYLFWTFFAVLFYFSMGIIEYSRHYGSGLDLEKLNSMKKNDLAVGAKENEFVYYFSANVMEKYSNRDLIYFEPIKTALLMPIPRYIYPNKPKGTYLREANILVFNSESNGAAFLNFVEAYIAFGWLGIILNGLFLGFLAKVFWTNYKNNKDSIGSILMLGLFNGLTYVFISRGYLAQQVTLFVYYIPMLYWISRIVLFRKK